MVIIGFASDSEGFVTPLPGRHTHVVGRMPSSTTTTGGTLTLMIDNRNNIKSTGRGKISCTTSSRTTYLTSHLLQAVDALWKANPYVAGAIVCGVKASAADFIAQKRPTMRHKSTQTSTVSDDGGNVKMDEKKGSLSSDTSKLRPSLLFDWRRNLGYLLYGSIYQGIAQEFIYNTLYPIIFGTGSDVMTVVKKVCFDLFFQTTLVTLPAAYYIKNVVLGTTLAKSTRQYLQDVQHANLLIKYFLLWGPVQAITFPIVPEHFRITFIAMVSFFWVIILSSIPSRTRPDDIVATEIVPTTTTTTRMIINVNNNDKTGGAVPILELLPVPVTIQGNNATQGGVGGGEGGP